MNFQEVLTDLSERFDIPFDDVESKVINRIRADYKSSWPVAVQADDWEIRFVKGTPGVKVYRRTPSVKKAEQYGSLLANISGFFVNTRVCRVLDRQAALDANVKMNDPAELSKYMKEKIELIVG